MNAAEIRRAYLDFFTKRGHVRIPRALLVPQNDPTTLFTGSGMQPLIPYLLGEEHPEGHRLTDSQTCFRAQDIEEVGDNRHTTFFEMLGNWSLGDYYKPEQINWLFEFLTKELKIDPKRLYVTCYIGNSEYEILKDEVSAGLWEECFKQAGLEAELKDMGSEAEAAEKGMGQGRIFFYDGSKNWWSRSGNEASTPLGDPCGPDSEVFFDLQTPHDPVFGVNCHPNCDCGRFVEIANSVFMAYRRSDQGFIPLEKPNVDFGGGLERMALAVNDNPDMFMISLLKPIIDRLSELSHKEYQSNQAAMRVIADHLRAAVFLAVDGVVPANKAQGYVMRRLLRRAIRFAFELGIEQHFIEDLSAVIADLYADDYPEVAASKSRIIEVLAKEEKLFRQTLRKGLSQIEKLVKNGQLDGNTVFTLYDTYGFPAELSIEEAYTRNIKVDADWRSQFEARMEEQRRRSQTATKGAFKGGLADHGEMSTKYHTATHLLYRSLRIVLGDHVIQRGSNITEERLRFDFSHGEKVTAEQLKQVEEMVNKQIKRDWPVSWREENTAVALANGVMGAFGDRYGERVKVYTVGDPDGEYFSREICGGPHVEHTGLLAENGRHFSIIKEEASSSGVRRIKAQLK